MMADSDQSAAIDMPDELEGEIKNIMWMRKNDPNDKALFYNVALEIWTAKDKLFASRVEKKTKQSLSVRNEIYQLIGFYSVFQGVLLTAVAQSNLLHCNNWWSAFTLSALASLVTVGGVIQKFYTVWSLEKTIGAEDITRKVKLIFPTLTRTVRCSGLEGALLLIIISATTKFSEDMKHAVQCLGRFLAIIGRDPSVSRINPWYVEIFQFCFTELRNVL